MKRAALAWLPSRRILSACQTLMCTLICAMVGGAATAQEMELGVGDQIAIIVTGLPSLDFNAQVLPSGEIDLVWLGEYDAAGRLVEELERDIRAATEGLIVKQYDREGALFLLQLEGSDINIYRSAFRPVVVTGSVNGPGEVAFTPDMTVRDALALAGGVDNRLLPDDVTIDSVQLTRWQSDFGQAAIDHADAVATIWRIEAELARDAERAFPTSATTSVSGGMLLDMENAQRAILAVNLETEASHTAFLARAIEQVENRLNILREQQANMHEALGAEEAEEARVIDLVQRGLAPGSREADVRRTTILTATRLLDVEDDLARTEIELNRARREQIQHQEDRVSNLLDEKVVADRLARDARLRMDVSAQFLALAGSDVAISDVAAEFGVTATIFRNTDGQQQEIVADMNATLRPGDTLEAAFEEIVSIEPPE